MPTFEGVIYELRAKLKAFGAEVNLTKKVKGESGANNKEDIGEIIANLTLCYRHIEDASMRLGKVLQHCNGGVSIYDENVVGSPEDDNTTPTPEIK